MMSTTRSENIPLTTVSQTRSKSTRSVETAVDVIKVFNRHRELHQQLENSQAGFKLLLSHNHPVRSSRWRHCRNNEERWTTTTTNSWLRGHDLTVGLFRPFLRDINYQRRRETTLPYETWHRSNGKQQYTALSQSPRGGGGGGAGGEGAGARGSTSSGITETTERRSRERALSISKFYLQNTQRFVLLKQLNNVGSRVDKHWFAVRDTLLKTDRLLTLAPINRNCTLNICPSTRDVLNKLFLTLQHPYICPILDLDFVQYENQDYVVLVQPINQGSLKDIIYGIERNCWNEDWSYKYGSRGKGLPLQQIQRMGRQILEALVFLKNRDFPTVSHLHSGNVISQNGVARLAALENTLLGFTSRIHPTIASRLHTSCRHPLAPESIDTVCFGHMLFEMTAGYELCTFEPTALNFADIQRYPQVWECLKFIFDQSGGRYPSIEQLILHDLFRNIDLRELRNASVNIFRPDTSTPISKILERIKRQKTPIKRFAYVDDTELFQLLKIDYQK